MQKGVKYKEIEFFNRNSQTNKFVNPPFVFVRFSISSIVIMWQPVS